MRLSSLNEDIDFPALRYIALARTWGTDSRFSHPQMMILSLFKRTIFYGVWKKSRRRRMNEAN